MANFIETMTLPITTTPMNEASLIERARREPAAFAELYRCYLNPVYRYLYTKTSNPADAEDLTSQTFLAALEGLPRYRHQGHFSAWLFAIARRKAADFYRTRPAQASLDTAENLPNGAEDPLGTLIQAEDLQALAKQVRRLPEDDQELLRLRFAARLDFNEIATLLNRKPSAVKMALYRLIERLENQMEVSHE